MPTIYIYARVTPKTLQPDESHASHRASLDSRVNAQIQKCCEYVQQHFPDEMRFIIREFVSARDLRFQAFVHDLGCSPAYYEISDNDIVVVHNVSRFSRDLERCTELLDKLSKRNIRVISATEGIDSISCREEFLSTVNDASKKN
jgi:DNA invertase Pin-like site-specific DNA recombinase